METPRNLRQRPARNPTPRLSERKKSLFAARNQSPGNNSDSEQENYALNGIAPLESSKDDLKNTNAKMRSVEVMLCRTPSKRISFLKNSNITSAEQMDDDLFEKLPDSPSSTDNTLTSPLRRSRRLGSKPKSRSPSSVSHGSRQPSPRSPPQKTFSDELPILFTHSMNLNKHRRIVDDEVIEESSEDETNEKPVTMRNKRNHITVADDGKGLEAKMRRLDNSDRLSISTKSFYSHSKSVSTSKSPSAAVIVRPSPKYKRPERASSRGKIINKGVHHNIKKKPKHKLSSVVTASKANVMDILGTIRNEKLRKLLTDKRLEKDQIENVHRILKSAKNPIEMAKPLSTIGMNNSANDGNNNCANRPMTPTTCYTNANATGEASLGFSDIECSSESETELNEEIVTTVSEPSANDVDEDPENRAPTPVVGRKFFKSGRSTTKMEVKITDNIRATVCNGKLSLMQETKKKKFKQRNTPAIEFSSEQAKVDEILKNFDISIFPEEPTLAPVPIESENQIEFTSSPTPTFLSENFEPFEEMRMTETETEEEIDYYEFRRRLPYNTNDAELIEQQHILLDFLITNKICTEENFAIFIADPDNHKEEAQRIVDQLVVVVGENPDNYRQRIPYNTTDPVEIEQQSNFLEFLIENNMCNEENFQIFIGDYANRHEEADRIITEVVATTHNISATELERELRIFNKDTAIENMELEIPDQNKQNQKKLLVSQEKEKLFPIFYPGQCQPIVQQKSTRRTYKTWNGGHGLNQYQIDAGQKQFGARQCKQCGLVYTVHEPEEEKLHKEYHASLYILKFKSWIDEDIVQIYPEWGNDGRILRLNEKSHVKRQERLRDVLQLVDKELGFSSYIMPTNFVAYFAVRQCQIVGVCLVQPLAKAHRYICVNGVDCCTEQAFDAKCGISRIWVSPLHRRFHIATKLIHAVQLHTIFGEEIPIEKVAFSAPTEDGKKFAKNVTKLENFLVYQ